MSIYIYIQYFFAQLLILCLGYNLINRVLIGYLTALFSIAILIPILARFVPGYVYDFIFLILILNLIFFLFKKKYLEIIFKTKKSFKHLIIFILINIFFIIFFKEFHFKNFVYEAHDIVYWSPSIELYLSDYIGNIKNFTYYPAKLAAHPLFPTSVLSSASILVTDLTLSSLLEIRYLLICNILTIASFLFYQVNNNYKKINYIFIFLLFITLLYAFESYIAYSLMYSGIFTVLIFILFLANFENTEETSIKFNSYLSLFLLVTKPGIMFIFVVFPIYYFFKHEKVRKDILFYILSLFVFLNMLTWIIIDKPVANFTLSIFNPFILSDYYQTLLMSSSIPLGSFFQNFEFLNNNYILNFEKIDTNLQNIVEAYKLQKDKINFDIFKFLIVFLFFFIIPFALILKNYKKKHVFLYFVTFSFIILFFLRNENIFGNKSTSQVQHILFIMPLLLTYIILKTSFNKNNLKLNLGIVVLSVFLFSNFEINFGAKILSDRKNSPESVSYLQFLKEKNNYNVTNGYMTNLKFNSINDVNKVELYALMLGKRIHQEEYDQYGIKFRTVLMNWSIERYHDFIWNDQIIKKNFK